MDRIDKYLIILNKRFRVRIFLNVESPLLITLSQRKISRAKINLVDGIELSSFLILIFGNI